MASAGKGKWIPADPMAPKVAVGEAGRLAALAKSDRRKIVLVGIMRAKTS